MYDECTIFVYVLERFSWSVSLEVALQELAKALRVASAEIIERAGSGHPGASLGMAEMAAVLWGCFLRHDPGDPNWCDRDRFVLSNGHASALLYALLHFFGYDLPKSELQRFRRRGSCTPGHPEWSVTPGVDTSTGPLGQGIAHAVGMAIAERSLAARFNRPLHRLVDHRTYVFAGDGCLMEGISHEACSLADGAIAPWFAEEVEGRFRAYGWFVQTIPGHDIAAIYHALQYVQTATRPSLIICQTTIGQGSPTYAGSAKIHGTPLGEEELGKLYAAFSWQREPFDWPAQIYRAWDATESGRARLQRWKAILSSYRMAYPALAERLARSMEPQLGEEWKRESWRWIERYQRKGAALSTRKASQQILEDWSPDLPQLLGGSADVTPSAMSFSSHTRPLHLDWGGNYLHYGVREFGMVAIATGMAVHGGCIPFVAMFLVFSDYAKAAIRLAALMGQRVIFLLTHDSIGVGEDGPTHQPVEQMENLRSIPNLMTWRPCDLVETAVAWREGLLQQEGPTALFLSRQELPFLERESSQVAAIAKGGYLLKGIPSSARPLLLLATGSEVALAVAIHIALQKEGIEVAVISMPSPERFDRQPVAYREEILPSCCTCRMAIEAGHPQGWYKYVGLAGRVVGVDRFGFSGTTEELWESFGFTVGSLCKQARDLWCSTYGLESQQIATDN